jgi:hypothetical protein
MLERNALDRAIAMASWAAFSPTSPMPINEDDIEWEDLTPESLLLFDEL